MGYRISGLPLGDFQALLEMDSAELRGAGVTVCVADEPGAYPCRITLEDAMPGEELLLLSHAHLAGDTPYAATGPIFVRRNATATAVFENTVPEQQRRRLLSVRAYDRANCMVDADVVEGTQLEPLIERFFGDQRVSFLHVHNARRGCYACRVDRTDTAGG